MKYFVNENCIAAADDAMLGCLAGAIERTRNGINFWLINSFKPVSRSFVLPAGGRLQCNLISF